jgi:hypothetical protein
LPERVPRLWPGSTIVCIASGPSLTVADVEYVRGKARVIVVNTTYTLAKWADVLYACDEAWWNAWRGAPDFPGMKFALQARAAKWPGVVVLRDTGQRGLEADSSGLKNGKNSGYQAINLAVHLGAERIILLGYDMRPRRDGVEHWHDPHPHAVKSTPEKRDKRYENFQRNFEYLAGTLRTAGVSVVNCSRSTALRGFLRAPLQAAL